MTVTIRMFRAGLGDCFLITFESDKTPIHVMIDCGVLIGTQKSAEKLTACLEDIHRLTGGRVDVLVATHEHWDHVSGFIEASAAFKNLTIGEIWFAWTEDPDDKLARRLRRDREARGTNLRAAMQLWGDRVVATELDGDPSHAGTRLRMTQEVLGFSDPQLLGARNTTADALDVLRKGNCDKEYLEPGTHRSVPGANAVRVYVLGPPRDERLLRKGRPSKRNSETYTEGGTGLTLASSMFASVAAAAAKTPTSIDPSALPFDPTLLVERQSLGPVPTTADEAFFFQRYRATDQAWRKIDDDWLGATSDLALALDNDTNNTSLVLAFELGEAGDVLLFPADAQVGNWLSWKELEFVVGTGRDKRVVTSDELLGRTVLYKVGHHASHNATLREEGLEKMTSPKLTAMIPVHGLTAQRVRWDMPFGPLYQRLLEKCHGRVIRLDVDEIDGRHLRRMPTAEADRFRRRVRAFPNYIELELE